MAFKPYNNHKRDKDYYKKYDESTNYQYVDRGSVKIFGFRSGKSYKMIPAMLYYVLAAIYIFSGVYGEFAYFEFEPMDYLICVLKYVFIGILAYSPIIFLSDFKYVDNLPFFKKKEFGSSLIGLILVAMFCTFMISVNKMCMSETYFKSADAYYAKIQAEQEKALAEMQTTTDNIETTTVVE